VLLLEWIAAWPGAVLLRGSGDAYALVNGAHILAIGLLIGSILPLDLRLLGLFRDAPVTVVTPFLLRFAAAGAIAAILTGLTLFSVKPEEYVVNDAFQSKMALLAAALANVFLQHRSGDFKHAIKTGEIALPVRLRAAASALLWVSVLLAGRWIGFL
jgi:hypothetical protein